MSAATMPIALSRFAQAIQELPVGNLYLKAAEIRNSVLHLESSNVQLQSYADDGDDVCAEAIHENRKTIANMEKRICLLKDEVRRRGLVWPDEDRARPHPVDDAVGNVTGSASRLGYTSMETVSEDQVLPATLCNVHQTDSEDGLHL